ncbi:MAG: hypothetical protein LUE23_04005 [Lachnospiraceae bacterium]|nr:hypothetical protein [Lachnospiraceae bacterium]
MINKGESCQNPEILEKTSIFKAKIRFFRHKSGEKWGIKGEGGFDSSQNALFLLDWEQETERRSAHGGDGEDRV